MRIFGRRWQERRRPRVAILAVLIGLAVVGVGVGVGLGGTASLRQISGQGTNTPTPRSFDAVGLDKLGLTNSEATRLAVRGGRAFYRIGSDCYAVGPAVPTRDYVYGQIRCRTKFPSAEQPILDFSTFGSRIDPMASVTRSEGFAADGIARVAFLSATGELLAETSVENNTYSFASLPKTRVGELHAYNAADQVVFSRELSFRPHRHR